MALEKKPLVSKTTSISAAPQKKRSVPAKVDTATGGNQSRRRDETAVLAAAVWVDSSATPIQLANKATTASMALSPYFIWPENGVVS